MKTQMNDKLAKLTMVLAIIALSSCGLLNKEDADMTTGQPGNSGSTGGGSGTKASTQSSDSKRYKQIERLGRPAINEGLVITNDYLNAFNSISPNLDLTAAAAPVVNEAGAVLTAVYNYGLSAGLPAPTVANVVAGFLPDVMRVDTSLNINIGAWAFNGDFVIVAGTSGGAMLTGGRKIEDDVMDVTLSYLIAGNPICGPGVSCAIPDGVSYAAGTTCATAGNGSNLGNPGHKCLHGQTARNDSAKFPFLSRPN